MIEEPICRGCGYRLSGLTGKRCPECGRAFDLDSPGSFDTFASKRRRLTKRILLVISIAAILLAGFPTNIYTSKAKWKCILCAQTLEVTRWEPAHRPWLKEVLPYWPAVSWTSAQSQGECKHIFNDLTVTVETRREGTLSGQATCLESEDVVVNETPRTPNSSKAMLYDISRELVDPDGSIYSSISIGCEPKPLPEVDFSYIRLEVPP